MKIYKKKIKKNVRRRKTTRNEEEKKNLETVDFSDRKGRIQSANSKQAILELGLDENKLYKLDKEKYLLKHPELKNEMQKIKDMNIKRKQKRNELIEKENEEAKYIKEEK